MKIWSRSKAAFKRRVLETWPVSPMNIFAVSYCKYGYDDILKFKFRRTFKTTFRNIYPTWYFRFSIRMMILFVSTWCNLCSTNWLHTICFISSAHTSNHETFHMFWKRYRSLQDNAIHQMQFKWRTKLNITNLIKNMLTLFWNSCQWNEVHCKSSYLVQQI